MKFLGFQLSGHRRNPPLNPETEVSVISLSVVFVVTKEVVVATDPNQSLNLETLNPKAQTLNL